MDKYRFTLGALEGQQAETWSNLSWLFKRTEAIGGISENPAFLSLHDTQFQYELGENFRKNLLFVFSTRFQSSAEKVNWIPCKSNENALMYPDSKEKSLPKGRKNKILQ